MIVDFINRTLIMIAIIFMCTHAAKLVFMVPFTTHVVISR